MDRDKEGELLLVALQLYKVEQSQDVPHKASDEAMLCLNFHPWASYLIV